VTVLLTILRAEKHPRVREQAIGIIGFLASTPKQISSVSKAMGDNYPRGDEREQLRTLDVMSNIPATDTAQVVTAIWRTAKTKTERAAAADAILKLAPRVTVDESVVRAAQALRAKLEVTPRDPDE
jgi:hypothetical protein